MSDRPAKRYIVSVLYSYYVEASEEQEAHDKVQRVVHAHQSALASAHPDITLDATISEPVLLGKLFLPDDL